MSSPTDLSVQNYLQEFDRLAARLPISRREGLRREIEEHLRGVIPRDASDAQVGAALANFGSPAEIISQELESSDTSAPPESSKRPRRVIAWSVAGLVVVLAAAFWLWLPGM